MLSKKKKKLVLHIGSHKTATTFIQGSLANNTDVLRKMGILYPKSGQIYEAHFRLCWKLRDPAFANTPLTEIDDWAALIEEIQADPAEMAIISAEEFGLAINPVRLTALKDIFDIQIVHYLRSPESYMESFYNQFVKDFITRETRPIHTYIAEERLHFLNTRGILEPWLNVFGQDAISLRIFSKDALKDGILHDLFKTIGVNSVPEMAPPGGSALQKVSLQPDALEYLRFVNHGLSVEKGHYDFVIRLVRVASESKALLQSTSAGILSYKARKTLRFRYAGANIWAMKTFLGTEISPFRVDDTPHPPEGFSDRPESADAEALGRVAAMIHNFENALNAPK